MASLREYKAIKNFFHNTEKINRAELKEVIKEVVAELIKEEVARYMKTSAAETVVSKVVKAHLPYMEQTMSRMALNDLLSRGKV